MKTGLRQNYNYFVSYDSPAIVSTPYTKWLANSNERVRALYHHHQGAVKCFQLVEKLSRQNLKNSKVLNLFKISHNDQMIT
jgi:hypothetical protein